jgi:hypothetical protein
MRKILLAALTLALLISGSHAGADVSWVITSQGAGPLKVGMTLQQAEAVLKTKFKLDTSDPDAIACSEFDVPGSDHLWVMFENRRLTRVSIGKRSHIRTARNIGIGSTEAEVAKAYQPLVIDPRDYTGLPAKDMTWWSVPNHRGIVFKTNDQGRVDMIHAGGPSIEYMEGCL